jgi:hypothetical protein
MKPALLQVAYDVLEAARVGSFTAPYDGEFVP